MQSTARILGTLAICAFGACPAGASDLLIDHQTNQVFDGGHYDRLIIQSSASITVRNAHFSMAAAGSVAAVHDSHDVVLEDSDLDGGGEACEGVSIVNSQNVTIARNAVHDIADDGLEIFDASGLMIDGNVIYRLIGKGTDGTIPGPCFNGHSDGIEITRVANSTINGNLIFDVRSSAAVFLSNDATEPSQYCQDLVFTNNVFVTPEASFTMYVFQTHGLAIRNNVIWKGLYGGLAVGDGVTDMDVTNTVLESINYSQLHPLYVPAEHRFSHNRVADVASWNQTPAIFGDERGNTTGEPDFAAAPGLSAFGTPSAWRQPASGPLLFAVADFAPAPDSPLVDQGDTTAAPAFDALRVARPQGVAADIGAVELVPEPGAPLLGVAVALLLAVLARRRRPPSGRTASARLG
jgi:hypothetical protein